MRGQQLFLCMREIRKAPLNEALREDDLHLDGSFSCKDDSEARGWCWYGGMTALTHARIRLLPGDKETSDQSDFSVFVKHDSDIADIETGSV